MNNSKILCTICARGGSKGVKNKNIKPILSKPLIAYTIEQAKKSELFKHIVVSTDSDDIANIAKEYGAEVFFKRSAEMASDYAGKLDVIKDAFVRSEEYYNEKYDYLVDLDATAPLRDVEDITNSFQQFLDNSNDNLITAMPSRRSPYFNLVEVDNKGKVTLSKTMSSDIQRRQDAPKSYDMNASIYIWKRDIILNETSLFLQNTGLYIMPEERSIDIDSELDYKFVEFLMKEKKMLTDKVVVITGGAGLLGQEFVKAVVQNNGVAIIADIDEELGNGVKNNLSEELNSNNIDYVNLDITSKTSLQNCIDYLDAKYKKIDALVNNAYPRNKNYGKHFFDVEYDDFKENLGLNLGGYFLTSQQFAKYFYEQGNGNIVNISSIYGVVAPKFEVYNNTNMTMPVEYAAIKSGLIHLTKYMAKYFKGKKIKVNAISPGGIFDSQDNNFLNNYKTECLNKGMLDKSDIMGTLVYLLSDMSKFVNGQNIIVDDGFTL